MKIGFIGTGNMAAAMIKGIVSSKLVENKEIFLSDANEKQLANLKNYQTSTDNHFVVENAEYIFLTVKPQFYDAVLEKLQGTDGKVFITVAPGITTHYIKQKLGENTKVVRTMPNTPALVGEGVTAVAYPDNLTEQEYTNVKKIISAFSECYEMEEKLLDPVVSVSGSSPAYSYMFINAIAKSGEKQGMDYQTALQMAAKTVLGAAKMLLLSDEGAETLIQNVCSKGGTTIEAVSFLNQQNFSEIIDGAMQKCTKRALELKK